jgi:pimeloyl-ACP methyl ester carboxylesterase
LKKHFVIISGWAAGHTPFNNIIGRSNNIDFSHLAWEKCVSDPGFALSFIKNTGRQVVLVAWSLGALIALKAAAEEPGIIGGLCLISGTSRMAKDADYAGADGRDIKAMALRLKKRREQVIKGFAGNCFNPGNEGCRDFLIKARTFSISDLSAGLEYLRETDCRELLARIKCRTIILHGLKDNVIPFSQSEYIHGNIKGSDLISFDAGHNLPYILDEENIKNIGCL